MKKVILIALTNTFLASFTLINSNEKSKEGITIDSKKIDINITITSTGGCKFVIKGESTFPYNNFSGSVTASGTPPCPNGVYTFRSSNPSNGNGATIFVGTNPFITMTKTDSFLLSQYEAAVKSM